MDFVEIFNNSYKRNIDGQYDRFFNQFYDNFMGKSDAIKKAFRNTNMEMQKLMLEDSLLYMKGFSIRRQSSEALEDLAALHRRLNIDASYFEIWLESLVETIEQIDPKCDENDLLAWRIILSPGIEFMKGFKQDG
ncbi:MAG: globin [Motiliproteus sp.]